MTTDQNSSDKENTNRLIHEKSPYLLQHAHNPVNWYPWGKEAFQKAQKEDKPIFLSIGYSSCHWCHVMEEESFEDPKVAELMNKYFVSIKVDREERPDIDNIYMTACQMMSGQGGWPLTIIMTPDKRPFFAATYIHRESLYGQIGMLELLPRLANIWNNQRGRALKVAREATSTVSIFLKNISGSDIGEETLRDAYHDLVRAYDKKNGGFGHIPKFPMPHHLTFLMRYNKRTKNDRALMMVENSLSAMRLGGVYDHVGFGFHRYSTDEMWLLPHFEKMLYDQALLALSYLDAFQITKKDKFARTAREIFQYVKRRMTSPEGAFYTAEDADTNGEEGLFYQWSMDEIRLVLEENETALAIKAYNLEESGNYQEESTGLKTGRNILYMTKDIQALARDLGMSEDYLRNELQNIRLKLFEQRQKRPRPLLDDKILTDWNGLMITALARGGRVLNEPEYTKTAAGAAQFVLENMQKKDGGLLHRFKDGEAAFTGNLDDYAFLTMGLLELYESDFNHRWLEEAIRISKVMIEHFRNEEDGGFYMTPDNGEEMLARPRQIQDGAYPAGNSIAMLNLFKLSRITGDSRYEKIADSADRSVSDLVKQSPVSFTQLLCGIDFALGPTFEVIIAGKQNADDTKEMIKALRSRYLPNKVVLFKPENSREHPITKIAPYISEQKALKDRATAYVCRDRTCREPVTDPQEMLNLLKEQ